MKKVCLLVFLISLCLVVSSSIPISYGQNDGLTRADFMRIAESGFDSPYNSYAWSMTYFKGDLYVGTARNVLANVGDILKAAGIIPPDFELPDVPHPPGKPGDLAWAEANRAEIWRYHNHHWERVYQAPIVTFLGKPFPREVGYRAMTTFTDDEGVEAIYAGVGLISFGIPPVILLRSDDGVNWQPVKTTGIPLTEIRGMIAHEGKLYVSGSKSAVYCTSNPRPIPEPTAWTKVCNVVFGDSKNTEIPELASFNGLLYASTVNPEEGFQVWRSTKTHPKGQGDWIKIVEDGYGDTWNEGAITMKPFKDHLYVGSAIWLAYDFERNKGPKGFDLIRIDKDDNVELVVGSYIPRDPPSGWPTSRVPLSFWPEGFGNIFGNAYCWSLCVHEDYLYLGTFDLSTFLRYIPPEMIESLIDEDTRNQIIDEMNLAIEKMREMGVEEQYIQMLEDLLEALLQNPSAFIEKLIELFGGGDLWKSPDGILWIPVTLNGFDNPKNYGIRTMVSAHASSGVLFAGTANPFDGCEVWAAARYPVGGEIVPIDMRAMTDMWIAVGLVALVVGFLVTLKIRNNRIKIDCKYQ